MNSPKTSVQSSAQVAALRAALPTDANERVGGVLDRLGALELQVEEVCRLPWAPMGAEAFNERAHAFSVMDEGGRDDLRAQARGRMPGFDALRASLASDLPPATAARLVARLDDAVEERAEALADQYGAEFNAISSKFPGKSKIAGLSVEEIVTIGDIRSLDLDQAEFTNLSPEAFRALAPQLGRLNALSLIGSDIAFIPREAWDLLIPELGKIRTLRISGNALFELPDDIFRPLMAQLGKVRNLGLAGIGLSSFTSEALGYALSQLRDVRNLDFGMNSLHLLRAADWAVLATFLGRLHTLGFSDNGMTGVSADIWKTLAPELMKVRRLDLRELTSGERLSSLDPAIWAPLSARPKGPDFRY